MRKASTWLQLSGVVLIAVGLAAFSVPLAAVVLGAMLIAIGEVHG